MAKKPSKPGQQQINTTSNKVSLKTENYDTLQHLTLSTKLNVAQLYDFHLLLEDQELKAEYLKASSRFMEGSNEDELSQYEQPTTSWTRLQTMVHILTLEMK